MCAVSVETRACTRRISETWNPTPRDLNEPLGWCRSSFMNTLHPAAADRDALGSNGVCTHGREENGREEGVGDGAEGIVMLFLFFCFILSVAGEGARLDSDSKRRVLVWPSILDIGRGKEDICISL
jgi:hypothetical protein